MIKLKSRRNKMPAIMLSPMIDMMFLLLIFFIVSTMQMTARGTKERREIPYCYTRG